MLTCFAKYDLLIDVFVVTNQANYKTTREFITEVGIALEQVILELLGSFTLERRAFRYLSRGNFCQSMSLFNKAVLYRVFSLTWPASMQIYWNKRKRLHKKRVQIPQDWFGTSTWPPLHCFGTPIWPS